MTLVALAAYEPDASASPEGDWDRSGDEPRWRQAHEALVADALHSWKGWPSDMGIHIHDELANAPQPGSGSGKKMRAQAAALLWELRHTAEPAPTLYRGSHVAPTSGYLAWSESRAVAQGWARKGGGNLYVLEGAKGLRVSDYINSQANDLEQEWIVEMPQGMVKTASDEDYRGIHQPSKGPPVYDLLEGDMMPEDVYDHPEWYTGYTEREFIAETLRTLKEVRGKPNATVTIYRGAPPGVNEINTGDWVTLSKSYARQHGLDATDPSKDWPVYAAQVPARTVLYAGDDLMEWGYWGPDTSVHTAARMAALPPPYDTLPQRDGKVLLWRGISEWGGELDYSGKSWTAQSLLDAIADEWNGYGIWWGKESEARFYGHSPSHPYPSGGPGRSPSSGVVVAAWWPIDAIGDPQKIIEYGHDGVLVPRGTVGEVERVEVYANDRWVELPARGMTVVAASWRAIPASEAEHPELDADYAIISVPVGRGSHFEVYDHGRLVAQRPSLDEAKDVFGSDVEWRRVLLPRQEVEHYYFGRTTEFSEPTTVYVRAARLAAWKRDPDGFGWYSPELDVFIERGAPMSGGGTAWLIWYRAKLDEYEIDGYGAYTRFGGIPLSRAEELGGFSTDPDAWYIHLNDAGSLSEAKETAEVVTRGRRG